MPMLSVWSKHRRDGYAPRALEFVIILSMMLLIGAATPIGAHLGSISPNPLWIPVLLLSSQYGIKAGVAAAVASMVVHWRAGAPPQADGSAALAPRRDCRTAAFHRVFSALSQITKEERKLP